MEGGVDPKQKLGVLLETGSKCSTGKFCLEVCSRILDALFDDTAWKDLVDPRRRGSLLGKETGSTDRETEGDTVAMSRTIEETRERKKSIIAPGCPGNRDKPESPGLMEVDI